MACSWVGRRVLVAELAAPLDDEQLSVGDRVRASANPRKAQAHRPDLHRVAIGRAAHVGRDAGGSVPGVSHRRSTVFDSESSSRLISVSARCDVRNVVRALRAARRRPRVRRERRR